MPDAVLFEQLLRERQPAVRLISERRLRKLLAQLNRYGGRHPEYADLPLTLDAHHLDDFGFTNLPARVTLLTPPDDRSLFDANAAAIATLYSRLLFFAEVRERLSLDDCRALWSRLTPPQAREVHYVLDAEQRLPDGATDDETAAAFAPWLIELFTYEPASLADYFPLSDERFKLPDFEFSLEELKRDCELPSEQSEPLVDVRPSVPPDVDFAELDRAIGRGNFVRAAVAAPQTPVGERALRDGLLGGLAAVLHWPASTIDQWHTALQPALQAANDSRWPRERRALYDLQRLAADHAGPLDAVAPVEWFASLGRQPLRRSLEPVRDVILLRRLRAALLHFERSSLGVEERQPLVHLLEAEIATVEPRIRAQFAPIFRRIFDDVGGEPASLPERIGRDKAIEELLDRLCERGFFRFADLRDAIARNHWKFPDLTGRALLRGDALLHADARFAEALTGVYHRGEIYLRFIQRFSSVAFGTPLGRWLTLFVALPFGGAFLAVEAGKHLAHVIAKLGTLLWRLVEKPVEKAATSEHHAPALDAATLTGIGVLGVVLLLVINLPAARRFALNLADLLGIVLRGVFLTLPQALLSSKLCRWLIDNRITRFVNVFVLLPAIVALSLMLMLLLAGAPSNAVRAFGAMAFAAIALLGATPPGRALREDVAETAHDMGRRVVGEFLPGLVSWILWVFRELLGALERGLYAIDEWFRYREGQSKPSLALKVVLALLWFPLAYVLRFAFYLLIEPQVNPIKHFPVVTVSHKVLIPLVESVKTTLNVSIETAGVIITCIPGIFGFLVWEFKENWRLYAANRRAKLPPAVVGHHGESVRGLLRPGFHSGTLPKLFRRLRRWWADPRPRLRSKLDHERHHLKVALQRLVDRDLFAYWRTVPQVWNRNPRLEKITLGTQRIEIPIAADGGVPLILALENRDGIIASEMVTRGWTAGDAVIEQSLAGFFTTAAAGAATWLDWLELWKSIEPQRHRDTEKT